METLRLRFQFLSTCADNRHGRCAGIPRRHRSWFPSCSLHTATVTRFPFECLLMTDRQPPCPLYPTLAVSFLSPPRRTQSAGYSRSCRSERRLLALCATASASSLLGRAARGGPWLPGQFPASRALAPRPASGSKLLFLNLFPVSTPFTLRFVALVSLCRYLRGPTCQRRLIRFHLGAALLDQKMAAQRSDLLQQPRLPPQ